MRWCHTTQKMWNFCGMPYIICLPLVVLIRCTTEKIIKNLFTYCCILVSKEKTSLVKCRISLEWFMVFMKPHISLYSFWLVEFLCNESVTQASFSWLLPQTLIQLSWSPILWICHLLPISSPCHSPSPILHPSHFTCIGLSRKKAASWPCRFQKDSHYCYFFWFRFASPRRQFSKVNLKEHTWTYQQLLVTTHL